MPPPRPRAGRLVELDPLTLFALLRLRVDVFVVEQECAYPELDAVDADPATEHLWLEVDGMPVATLRTYVDGEGRHHLGRVATRVDSRGQGYASALVEEGLRRIGPHPVHIGAQAHLEGWYERFGFRRSGPDYREDGIPHLPMVRDVTAGAGPAPARGPGPGSPPRGTPAPGGPAPAAR